MASINVFAVLDVDSSDLSQAVSEKKVSKKVGKKVDKKGPKAKTSEPTLKDDMTAFELENPVGAILFHYKGKDQYLIFKFKFSQSLQNMLLAHNVKKITLPVIEKIINDRVSKPNDVVVWTSYFVKETLQKLTEQEECFETPREFQATFDLVRGGSITDLKYSPAIIFDFRMKNSGQEFVYLPGGSRIHFGRSYDDHCVDKRRTKLESMMKHYDKTLKHFDLAKVYDARDEIFSLTDDDLEYYSEARQFANEAERHIANYVHLYHKDEQTELRNLLSFVNWNDDLKKEFEKAIEYRNALFDMLEDIEQKVYKYRECKEKALELQEKEAFPSLS